PRRARPVRPATSRHALRRMTPTTPLPSDTHATPTVSKLLPICVITPAPPRRRRSTGRCARGRSPRGLLGLGELVEPLQIGAQQLALVRLLVELVAERCRARVPRRRGRRHPGLRQVPER